VYFLTLFCMNKAQLQARFKELSGETAPEELTNKQLSAEINILEKDLESDTDIDSDTNTDVDYLDDSNNDGTNDSDGDTITDADEVKNGTDPLNEDTDGDGISDADESNTTYTDTDTGDDESTPATTPEVFVATQTLNISGSFVNEGDELEFSDDNEKLRDELLEKGYITAQ